MVIFEFGHLTTIDADEMVVGGAVEKIRVVGGLPVAEVDLVEEVSFDEKRKSPVDGGAGGAGTDFAEALKKFFGGEVFIRVENELHNGIALGGLAQTFGADEGVELFANGGRHHGDAPISN